MAAIGVKSKNINNRIVDLSSHLASDSEDARFRDISYLVLAKTGTLVYRFGEGNIYDWRILAPNLLDYIDREGKQISLDDVGIINPFKTVILHPRVLENGYEKWFCRNLLSREIVLESSPVLVLHPDGFEENLGTVGFLASEQSLSMVI